MKKKLFKTRMLSFAAFCGLTFAFVSCANEDVAQNPNSTDNDKNLTTFSTGNPLTRTSMESDGKFFWRYLDRIWVQDDNETWQKSYNYPQQKTASFEFEVPGKFTKGRTYKVYYPGVTGSQNQVKILQKPRQIEPNTSAHFGVSGDCGMADARWSNTKNGFEFSLDHKAAYLVLLPYTSNTALHKCYLTQVNIFSDNEIARTCILDPTTGKLKGTGNGNWITLTTKGRGTYANGFPLTNTAPSAATNGTYVVIEPGTHTLEIRYWVKDTVTNVEGVITKKLASATYEQNKFYNITAKLDVRDYDGDHYYEWDAKEQYWWGHEWNRGGSQPTLEYRHPNATTSNDDPDDENKRDPRRFTEAIGMDRIATQKSFLGVAPNANEMSWYCVYGDPYWDSDELWTTMGHLYKGGIWLKKKSTLQAEHLYDTEKSPNGTDMCITATKYDSKDYIYGRPSAANIGNYFFLPALGNYFGPNLGSIGERGSYWSSTPAPKSSRLAYNMVFTNNRITIETSFSANGYRVSRFE